MGTQKTLPGTDDAVASTDGGEGAGGIRKESESARTRNSSGARGPSSQLIDLHLKVRILTRATMALATQLGDEQLVADLKAVLNGKP